MNLERYTSLLPDKSWSLLVGPFCEAIFAFLLYTVFESQDFLLPCACFFIIRQIVFVLSYFGQERRRTPDSYAETSEELVFTGRHETFPHMRHRLRHDPAFHEMHEEDRHEKLGRLWDRLDQEKYPVNKAMLWAGSVRMSLCMIVCSFLPFLVYCMLLSTAFIQPDVHTIVHMPQKDVVYDASNATSHHLRVCSYQLESKRTTVKGTIMQSLQSMRDDIMMYNELPKENVVEYKLPHVRCKANSTEILPATVAPYSPIIINVLLAYAVPLLYGIMVFSTMRSIAIGTPHTLHIHQSFHELQAAIPDFFDACWFISICFHSTGVNFAYLALNPQLYQELVVAFAWTYILAIFETVLAFKLLTGLFGSTAQTPRSSSSEESRGHSGSRSGKAAKFLNMMLEHHGFTSVVSLLVNVPLASLRFVMYWKGLHCSSIMALKNVISITTSIATLSTGDSHNPISLRVKNLTSSLPGFQLLKEEEIREAHRSDKARMKKVFMYLNALRADLQSVSEEERGRVDKIHDLVEVIAKDEKVEEEEGIVTYSRRKCCFCCRNVVDHSEDYSDDDITSARDVYISDRNSLTDVQLTSTQKVDLEKSSLHVETSVTEECGAQQEVMRLNEKPLAAPKTCSEITDTSSLMTDEPGGRQEWSFLKQLGRRDSGTPRWTPSRSSTDAYQASGWSYLHQDGLIRKA